jgi:hypothetical protein
MSSSQANLALVLLAAPACGDSVTETKDQPLAILECEEGFAPTTLVGARQLAEGDCIDTEEAVALELCLAPKSLDIPLFTCVAVATGERYWVRG